MESVRPFSTFTRRGNLNTTWVAASVASICSAPPAIGGGGGALATSATPRSWKRLRWAGAGAGGDPALFRDLQAARCHFLLGVKPGDHAYLFEQVAQRLEADQVEITGDAEAFIDGAHPTAGPQLADVVHTGAEAVSLDREGVAPASRGVVLLEHQRPEAGLLESDGRGEPAGAGADHDHVEVGHAEYL